MQLEDSVDIKSVPSLENYDVGKAIRLVNDVGRQLCSDTDSAVHRFRMEWVEQLVKHYQTVPGRPIIHLNDLDNFTTPLLSEEARPLVFEPFQELAKLRGVRSVAHEFGNIYNFATGRRNAPARLRSWRGFSSLTGFDINSLEPHVKTLLVSSGRVARVVNAPKLPFNLATPYGGKLIGYRLDSNYRNSAFTNKNPVLHLDYRRAVRGVVGGISISETRTRDSGFTSDVYLRTNVGYLVSRILSVGGCDNTQEQRLANSPIPLWLFLSRKDVIIALIAALWDAEGSIDTRDLKLRQAIGLPEFNSGRLVPRWPLAIEYGELEDDSKEQLLHHPPRILISTAILLRHIGIVSRTMPERISNTKGGVSAYWHLRIHGDNSILTFFRQINLLSRKKREKLWSNVQSVVKQ